jgi:hypothetical protein
MGSNQHTDRKDETALFTHSSHLPTLQFIQSRFFLKAQAAAYG